MQYALLPRTAEDKKMLSLFFTDMSLLVNGTKCRKMPFVKLLHKAAVRVSGIWIPEFFGNIIIKLWEIIHLQMMHVEGDTSCRGLSPRICIKGKFFAGWIMQRTLFTVIGTRTWWTSSAQGPLLLSQDAASSSSLPWLLTSNTAKKFPKMQRADLCLKCVWSVFEACLKRVWSVGTVEAFLKRIWSVFWSGLAKRLKRFWSVMRARSGSYHPRYLSPGCGMRAPKCCGRRTDEFRGVQGDFQFYKTKKNCSLRRLNDDGAVPPWLTNNAEWLLYLAWNSE